MFDMRRREFIALFGGTTAWPFAALAQQAERLRRIAVLMNFEEDDPDTKERLAGFRHELERIGWSDGRNVRIDYRFAPAGVQATPFAKELLALQPDVILAVSTPITAALQRETRTVPIVFVGITADPIRVGAGREAETWGSGSCAMSPLQLTGSTTGFVGMSFPVPVKAR